VYSAPKNEIPIFYVESGIKPTTTQYEVDVLEIISRDERFIIHTRYTKEKPRDFTMSTSSSNTPAGISDDVITTNINSASIVPRNFADRGVTPAIWEFLKQNSEYLVSTHT
jgi:hypothetical protein